MNRIVEKISLSLDVVARFMVASIMFVTTFNVILRLFGSTFKGSIEIVQLLNALVIGLALAHCAVQGGHVAVTFFTDKLPKKIQSLITIIVDFTIALFLGLTALQLYHYGNGLKQTGEIALTTGISIYPLVYVVAIGFAVYLLVVLLGIINNLQILFSTKKVATPSNSVPDVAVE